MLHELHLEVEQEPADAASVLDELLLDLSCVPAGTPEQAGALRLTVQQQEPGRCPPPWAREVFRADGFTGLEEADDFYLSDGASFMHLQAAQGQGTAHLVPTFFRKPLPVQRTFWAFGLLKLLRPHGFFSLHAAGIVSPAGTGVLLVGPSGSGKSTLTVGMLRHGWHYLSDDAVLLRRQQRHVIALAFRKYCAVDASAAAAYTDFSWGKTLPDSAGRTRIQLRLADAYPDRAVAQCVPRVLLFTKIVSAAHSTVRRVDPIHALQYLLAQSGPQLFDRRTMARHLDTLQYMVRQAIPCELCAGRDLYLRPDLLASLLDHAGEEHYGAPGA
jgi:hypothetical protein